MGERMRFAFDFTDDLPEGFDWQMVMSGVAVVEVVDEEGNAYYVKGTYSSPSKANAAGMYLYAYEDAKDQLLSRPPYDEPTHDWPEDDE